MMTKKNLILEGFLLIAFFNSSEINFGFWRIFWAKMKIDSAYTVYKLDEI